MKKILSVLFIITGFSFFQSCLERDNPLDEHGSEYLYASHTISDSPHNGIIDPGDKLEFSITVRETDICKGSDGKVSISSTSEYIECNDTYGHFTQSYPHTIEFANISENAPIGVEIPVTIRVCTAPPVVIHLTVGESL